MHLTLCIGLGLQKYEKILTLQEKLQKVLFLANLRSFFDYYFVILVVEYN